MKKADKQIEEFTPHIHPRPSTTISIQIPIDAWTSLEKVASGRDMSPQALIKFYVGQGLRENLTQLFADHVLGKTAQVLTRHIQSEEEVSE